MSHPTPLPIATRRCPACGDPMFLSVVEPTYQRCYDVRTFECTKCTYAEFVLVNFDQTRGDEHASTGVIQHETVKVPDEDEPRKEEAR